MVLAGACRSAALLARWGLGAIVTVSRVLLLLNDVWAPQLLRPAHLEARGYHNGCRRVVRCDVWYS